MGEHSDWMRDGGACTDCVYNVFLGSDAVCVQDMPGHKEEKCEFFEECDYGKGS